MPDDEDDWTQSSCGNGVKSPANIHFMVTFMCSTGRVQTWRSRHLFFFFEVLHDFEQWSVMTRARLRLSAFVQFSNSLLVHFLYVIYVFSIKSVRPGWLCFARVSLFSVKRRACSTAEKNSPKFVRFPTVNLVMRLKTLRLKRSDRSYSRCCSSWFSCSSGYV